MKFTNADVYRWKKVKMMKDKTVSVSISHRFHLRRHRTKTKERSERIDNAFRFSFSCSKWNDKRQIIYVQYHIISNDWSSFFVSACASKRPVDGKIIIRKRCQRRLSHVRMENSFSIWKKSLHRTQCCLSQTHFDWMKMCFHHFDQNQRNEDEKERDKNGASVNGDENINGNQCIGQSTEENIIVDDDDVDGKMNVWTCDEMRPFDDSLFSIFDRTESWARRAFKVVSRNEMLAETTRKRKIEIILNVMKANENTNTEPLNHWIIRTHNTLNICNKFKPQFYCSKRPTFTIVRSDKRSSPSIATTSLFVRVFEEILIGLLLSVANCELPTSTSLRRSRLLRRWPSFGVNVSASRPLLLLLCRRSNDA